MTAPGGGPRRAPLAGVLLIVAGAVGVAELVAAALLWAHGADVARQVARLGLPPVLMAAFDVGTVRETSIGLAAFTILLGVATLVLVPLGVLVWRGWPPARLVLWIAGGLLLVGQVLQVAGTVVVRWIALGSVSRKVPASVHDWMDKAMFPGWYLPTAVVLAVVMAALLVTGTVLAGTGRRPGPSSNLHL